MRHHEKAYMQMRHHEEARLVKEGFGPRGVM